LLLAPLPSRSSSSSPAASSSSPASASALESKLLQKMEGLSRDISQMKRKHADVSRPPPPPHAGGKGGKGDMKKRRNTRMPNELRNKEARTPNGEPICYNFNMKKGCKECKPGEKCKHGKHVCCEPGCFGNHSLVNHR